MTRIGSSDLDVFGLNLGGNVFGWTADRETSFAILDAYAAGGGNFVDTSDSYSAFAPGNSGGESETILGEWVGARGNRDSVVIATKVSRHPKFLGLGPDNIRAACDASLGRLGTDHIDLYYAHYDDPSVPMPEIVGALSGLVDTGKVRYLAISNFTADRIDEWFTATEADGLHRAVALQPHYNLVERDYETNGLRDAAQRHQLGVMPYYALAAGFLSGKYRAGVAVDSPRAEGAGKYVGNPAAQAALAAVEAVASERGVGMATVALAWLRQQPTVVSPIASVSKPEQLPDLIASATLELTVGELDRLRRA